MVDFKCIKFNDLFLKTGYISSIFARTWVLPFFIVSKRIFIIAGEASGDMHAANMLKELFLREPHAKVQGWGGHLMKEAGCELLKDFKELAFMGFYEVVKNLPAILKNFSLVKEQIRFFQPEVVVLVDYPGFNLRLLPWLKKQGYKVVYYIAPQAWAWKEGRVKKMAQYIDRLLVILPFELEFFRMRGVNATFVGHPLLQVIPAQKARAVSYNIALLPGSRKQEIAAILPQMLQVIDSFPNYTFTIAGLGYLGEDFYQRIVKDRKVDIVYDDSVRVINRSDLALVSSGTATLQTALMGIPLIVCYKSSQLNYEIARRLIRVPYIALVNLIFQKRVVTELIQHDLQKDKLVQEMNQLLSPSGSDAMKNKFKELWDILGSENASRRAADIILSI